LSWLEVDWKREPPGEKATNALWKTVEARQIDDVPTEVETYLTELRRVNVNGGAEFARFRVSGSKHFDWFATRNRWDEMAFCQQILVHPSVCAALPAVTKDARLDDTVAFEWSSSLTLDGELAGGLLSGGAYEKFKGTAREAKDLGARVCQALFGDRFNDVEVFRSRNAWSAWFFNVAWDSTFVIIDRRTQDVSLLFSTDTD
jgi:hypothetical protein